MKLPISIFTVFGNSMEPTLKPGQRLVSLNWGFKFRKGDLVAVKNGDRLIVKRISDIKKDQIYLLGDNQEKSTDSRKFGWISKNKILGKVIWIT